LIRKFIRSFSLRQKLMISIVLCLIAPPLIAINVSNYLTKDVLREQAVTFAKESLDVANLFVTDLINSMVYITNNIQFDNESTTLLKKLGQSPRDSAEMVLKGPVLTNKLETLTFSKDHMYITVLLPNGAYFTNYAVSEFNPVKFFQEPWFSQLDQMTEYDINWVGVHANYIQSGSKSSPYMITIARVLKASDSKPYAYVILSSEEQHITDFFKKYLPSQRMGLLDSNGKVLASFNDNEIGKAYPYYPAVLNQSESDFPLVDNQFILLSENLPFSKWKLVSLVRYQNAVGEIQRIRKNDYLIQISFLIIFIILLFWLVNRITKPMIVLVRVASHVKNGSLNHRANIRGSDEIGRLGQVFDQMLDQISAMIAQIKEEQSRKHLLELEVLQAQINPHFLFNLLNSIRLKTSIKGDEESADIISSLSKLLRMTINRNNEFQPVHVEVDLVRHYVKLINYRHNQKVQFEESIASNVLLEELPRFTIQPLIENAFIHGLSQKHGTIILSIWREDIYLVISVEDNGVGIMQETMNEIRKSFRREKKESLARASGIGLKNINERLAIIYGPLFQMDIQSDPHKGTQVILKLPLGIKGEEQNVQSHDSR